MPRLRAWPFLVAVLALAACQSNDPPAPTGFLGSMIAYDRMQEVEGVDGLWVWHNAWNPRDFENVVVAPVEVSPGAAGALAPEDVAVVQSLADHFQAEVQRVAAKHLTLTDQPGPDALLVMAAIVGVDPSQPAANLAPTGRGAEERARAAHVEMKVVNGGTGAPLATLTAYGPRPSDDALPDAPDPNPRVLLSEWAALLGEYLLAE